MKFNHLLFSLFFLFVFSGLKAQEPNPFEFNCPYIAETDECGQTFIPWFYDYSEFVFMGGSAHSECGIVESSFQDLGYASFYDEYFKKIVVETQYSIEDSCGNIAYCSETYFQEPTVIKPKDIYQTKTCGSLEDIETFSGLPFSAYSQISASQFIAAGGFFRSTCFDTTFYQIEYSDFINLQHDSCSVNITRRFTVFDYYGNIVDLEQIIVIESRDFTDENRFFDFHPPFLWEKDECGRPLIFPISDYNEFVSLGGIANSDCGIVDSTFSKDTSFTYYDSFFDKIVHEYFYSVLDECGNLGVCKSYVFEEPYFETPNDIYTNSVCMSNGYIESVSGLPYSNGYTSITKEQFIAAGGSFTNNCEAPWDIDIHYYDYTNNYNPACPIRFTRIFHIHDFLSGGGGYDFQQQITIEDTQAPEIIAPNDTVIYGYNYIPEAFSSFEEFVGNGGSASDNCTLMEHSFRLLSETTDHGYCSERITRTYEIADTCGNKSTCQHTITVNDQEPPTIVCPPDLIVECIDEIPTPYTSYQEFSAAGGNITDDNPMHNSLNNPLVVFLGESYSGTCPVLITRNYEAIDTCGNTSFCQQIITVMDTTPPTIVSPTTIIQDDSLGVPAPIAYFYQFKIAGGSASDNCALDEGSFSLVNEVSFGYCPQVITRTYQIADSCGNTATATHIIEYFDSTPPIMQAPPNIAVECSNEVPLPFNDIFQFVQSGGMATDNMVLNPATFNLVSEISNHSMPEVITRTYEIADSCGNISNCTHAITVEDITPPTIICPQSISVECTLEVPSAFTNVSQFQTAGGNLSDNCELDPNSFQLKSETSSGTCPKTITRTYQVSDLFGNSATDEQTITIMDNTPPVFTTLPAIIADIYHGDDLPLQEDLTYSDNCSIADYIKTIEPYTEDPENGYTITYLWTVTDSCGNTSQSSASFNVLPSLPKYCMPSGSAGQEWIASVSIGTETYSSSSEDYVDFTENMTFNLETSSVNDITLTPGFSAKNKFEYWSVWIDFNLDEAFTEDEKVFTANRKKSAVSGTITIPDMASITTRMRIIMSRSGIPQACDSLVYGEIEDYTVNINAAIPKPPVAQFKSNLTTIEVGGSIEFSDNSTNNPTSWEWYFEGGTPVISTEANPSVQYNSIGTFDVLFYAGNSTGTDSIYMEDYITVTEKSLGYCESKSLDASQEYISSVAIGDLANSSDAQGYSDFTNLLVHLNKGESYPIELIPDFQGKIQREYWKVWIDLDGDNIFEMDEEVFSANNKRGTVSGTITIPVDALADTARMRISMKNGSAPVICETFNRGEVEDYTLVLSNSTFKSAFVREDEGISLEKTVVSVYPNPSKNRLYLSVTPFNKPHYQVFNMHGAKLLEIVAKSEIEEIDVSNFAAGVYYLVVKNGDEIFREKFVKE